MAANRIAIGDRLYLFTDPASPADYLAISSHGTYFLSDGFHSLQGGWFPIPRWTTLHFFVDHSVNLDDPGITNIARYNPTDTYPPGAWLRDYHLTKYQGKHGNPGETYDFILNQIDANRARAQARDNQRAGASPEQLATGLLEPVPRFDVLTIRNPLAHHLGDAKLGVRLKFVLSELDRTTHRYAQIRCSFCRGNAFETLGKSAIGIVPKLFKKLKRSGQDA